jgi:uncharacterized membrane protein
MSTPVDGENSGENPADALPQQDDRVGGAATIEQLRPPARALKALEDLSVVDAPAAKLAETLQRVLPTAASALLRGHWLGHPLHPILVTVPIGAWIAVPLLDVTGQPAAARQLLAFGVAASLPASATGLVEFTTLDVAQRRVALLHMAANTLALSCFGRSWWQRRRGGHLRGVGWTVAGLTVAGVSGALGGHLSYSQGAGVGRER